MTDDKLFVLVNDGVPTAGVTRDLATALKASVLLHPHHVVVIDLESDRWEYFEAEFLRGSTDEDIASAFVAAPGDTGRSID